MASRWETTALRLEPATVRRLEALASQHHITVSAVARLALEHGLDRAERGTKASGPASKLTALTDAALPFGSTASSA
jgi:hypothetical protein